MGRLEKEVRMREVNYDGRETMIRTSKEAMKGTRKRM